MTKRELQEYRWIQDNIEELQNRIEEVETQATKMTTALKAIPIGGNQEKDKTGRLICKMVELKKQLNKEVEAGIEKMQQIEAAIENIDEREKRLIRLRYIKGYSWIDICAIMNYEWAHTHRIHASALKNLNHDMQ